MRHHLVKLLIAFLMATTALAACGSNGSAPTADSGSPVNQKVSLPTGDFSSERSAIEFPDSVVEQGIFQTLSEEKQKLIRSYEAMDLQTYTLLPSAEKASYGQFLAKASAPYVIAKYQSSAEKYGYASLPQSSIDAYLNGVTEDNSAQDLENRRALIETAATSMYEKYHGQELAGDTRYTQGDDKDYVFNVLEAQKLITSLYAHDGTSSANGVMNQKVEAIEPLILISYYKVLPDRATPWFKSKNFSIFQTGTDLSTADIRLRIDQHVEQGMKNGGKDEAAQSIFYLQDATDLETGKSIKVSIAARLEGSTSRTYYADLEQFYGPGYGY